MGQERVSKKKVKLPEIIPKIYTQTQIIRSRMPLISRLFREAGMPHLAVKSSWNSVRALNVYRAVISPYHKLSNKAVTLRYKSSFEA